MSVLRPTDKYKNGEAKWWYSECVDWITLTYMYSVICQLIVFDDIQK